MIALLCSVQTEGEHLLSRLTVSGSRVVGSTPVTEGIFEGRDVALCVAGMGKANAAHAATLLAVRYEPQALITFGVGGAYPSSGAAVGHVALAREEIAGDEGVLTHDGFKGTEYIGIPLLKTASSTIYNIYPASAQLLADSIQALGAGAGNGAVHVGRFVTLSTCSGTRERAREMEERYRALCENMEGAAVAQVAELHGIPWIEVRGISNIVEDRDLAKWDVPRAALAAQEAVLSILKGWSR